MLEKRVCIAVVVILFLACLVAGIGWLTTKWDLQASQIINERLRAENEQYALSFGELIGQTEPLANCSSATIGDLEQKLAEAERYGTFWWERAHPREFESLEELTVWLAEDDTDSTIYIFGYNCLANYKCLDYARALVHNALEDGYSISIQINGCHVFNTTIIGDTIYGIEPQTDEVWPWK